MNIQKISIDISDNDWPDSIIIPIHALGIPAFVIEPDTDQFLAYNISFRNLFDGSLPAKPSCLFRGNLGGFIALLDAVDTEGGAQTSDLSIQGAQLRTTFLIQGSKLKRQPRAILFTCLALDLFERSWRIREADESIRAGLLEWRRLEALYNQAETMNELILNSAGDGIFGLDAAGRTTFMNPAAASTLGWDEADLIGHDMHHLIHHHHASGTPYFADECPIQDTLRNGAIHQVDDEVFWTKAGKSIPVEYLSTPIYRDQKIHGAVILFRDISQRIETERALQAALKKVDSLKHRLELENEYLRAEVRVASNHATIIGDSAATKQIIEQIEIVAPTSANVLITGESGTGKELVAQAIHDASDRSSAALIRVNCAAIPKDLFESEFFGHVKGAFSGAISDRIGRFELANGGTLFLDEVGEIPIELQGKLLRALQEQRYERVGEGTARQTDVRIVAATNRNLQEEVKRGQFREDLYFRLNVFPIHCSPLRHRIEDIPPLTEHFIESACRRFNIPKPFIGDRLIRELQHYPWPGNARELQNVLERGCILAGGGELQFVSDSLVVSRIDDSEVRSTEGVPAIQSLKDIEELEKKFILDTVADCYGRISGPFGAARRLDMNPQTLYTRLKKYQCQVT